MKTLIGTVVSEKMNKVASVSVGRQFPHPMYGKIMRREKKIHASNTLGAKIGEVVKLVETRPQAKTVNFKISEILSKKEGEKK